MQPGQEAQFESDIWDEESSGAVFSPSLPLLAYMH